MRLVYTFLGDLLGPKEAAAAAATAMKQQVKSKVLHRAADESLVYCFKLLLNER